MTELQNYRITELQNYRMTEFLRTGYYTRLTEKDCASRTKKGDYVMTIHAEIHAC